EGALTQVNSMLNRMHDLIVQSANTASSDSTARTAAQNEIDQLRDEIDRIGQTTSFGNQNLLDGSFGAQAAKLSSTSTGLTSGVTVAANGGSSLSNNFTLIVDEGRSSGSLAVSVYVNEGAYAAPASFQTDLQNDVNAGLSGNNGFTGAVTVKVTDLGSGVWTTTFSRNSQGASTGVAIEGIGNNLSSQAGFTASGSASVSNATGGVFQVG